MCLFSLSPNVSSHFLIPHSGQQKNIQGSFNAKAAIAAGAGAATAAAVAAAAVAAAAA